MKFLCLLSIVLLTSTCSLHAERVRVTADDVNIRSDSNLTSRVMGQVSHDTILEAVSIGDEWVSVLPPAEVSAWIHGDLVADSKVATSKANIRSGPGINYNIMTSLRRGDSVTVQGNFAEWLKINPPEGSVVWISRKFIEPLAAATASAAVTKTPGTNPVNDSGPLPVGVVPKPPKPARLTGEDDPLLQSEESNNVETSPSLSSAGVTSNMLVSTTAQGVEASYKGVLRRTSALWRRPSRYILTGVDQDEGDPLCYVTGSDQQLESVLGRKMTVEGTLYTVQGARFPLLMASKIVLH